MNLPREKFTQRIIYHKLAHTDLLKNRVQDARYNGSHYSQIWPHADTLEEMQVGRKNGTKLYLKPFHFQM